MNKSFVFAVFAMTVSLLSAEDMALSGDYTVTVASGSTETISDKVTGSGRIILLGGGTLVLNNSANDFTGGVIVSNGVLRADASGAFGTGPISLEGTAQIRTVQFNANIGVFNNAITLKDIGTSAANPAIHVSKYAQLNGRVSADASVASVTDTAKRYFYIRLGSSSDDKDVEMLNLKNELDVGSASLYVIGWSRAYFREKVTANSFYLGNNSSNCGTVSLYKSENQINRVVLGSFDIQCQADNVLRGATVTFNFDSQWWANGHCIIYVNGFNQTFSDINSKYVLSEQGSNVKPNDFGIGIVNYTQNPSLITVNGEKSNENGIYTDSYIRFSGGPISVHVEKTMPYAFYQRFGYRNNVNVGDLSVAAGNLEFRNNVVFTAVTNLNITGGAAHFNVSTNSMPALKRMTVSNGKLVCKSVNFNAFGEGTADMHLRGAAVLAFENGATNTVRKLYVNGEYMPAGTYTKANLPAMEPSGDTGALVVLRGRSGGFMIVR